MSPVLVPLQLGPWVGLSPQVDKSRLLVWLNERPASIIRGPLHRGVEGVAFPRGRSSFLFQ